MSLFKDRRFDPLAFDEQSKSFVIIEYKRDRNTSVIDRGFTYLNLMLNNKAEFVLEINERLGRKFKRDEIDWTQTKIIFVSSSFTENQKQATNLKDISIELWEARQYENEYYFDSNTCRSFGANRCHSISFLDKRIILGSYFVGVMVFYSYM